MERVQWRKNKWKPVQIGLRLPAELYRKIQKHALEKRVSINFFVVSLLKEYFKE